MALLRLCLAAAAVAAAVAAPSDALKAACYAPSGPTAGCAGAIAKEIVRQSEACLAVTGADEEKYNQCCQKFCGEQCSGNQGCDGICYDKASHLLPKLVAAAKAKPPALVQ